MKAEDPRPEDLYVRMTMPYSCNRRKGEREPSGKKRTVMVDCALFAVQELMSKHPECLLYGQDVGGRLVESFVKPLPCAKVRGRTRLQHSDPGSIHHRQHRPG